MRTRPLQISWLSLVLLFAVVAPVHAQEANEEVKYGVGLRLRQVFMPKAMIELFVEQAASGMSQTGIGVDFIRRKGNMEFSVGLEYDGLSPDDGYYVERGGATNKDGTVDFVEFDGLGWVTLDFAFVYHKQVAPLVALRYGGGFGMGVVVGDVIETDAVCTGANTNAQKDCQKNPGGAQVNEKQDFFRFPPVVNLLGGVQVTPIENLAIQLEVGMRTVFYVGLGTQYFF